MSSTCRACESGYEEPHSCGYTDEPPEQKPTSVIFDVLMGDPLAQLDRIEAKLDQLLAKKKPKVKANFNQLRPAMVESAFSRWWKVYPRKKSKQDALKAFTTAVKYMGGARISGYTDFLIADTERRLQSDWSWIKDDGAYRPLAGTYLRGKRWEDEITPIPKKKTSEDPDKQHHKTFDPDAKVFIVDGIDPYAGMK